jgi:energy-coupling factor transport system ATP-binding protein
LDVKLENLYFSYDPDLSHDDYVLENINLDIKEGEFALICGGIGSGKTTLAQMIAGIMQPTKGKVFFNGRDIFGSSHKALKKKVGMIFQIPEQQLFEKTVFEDITFVLRRDGQLSEAEIKEAAADTLHLVGLDYEEYKDRLSFSLSSGEKRKAAIACVLINSPDLIIFDEPTVGLDFVTKKSLVKIIKRLHGEEKTIVCISHDINRFLDVSNKIFILKKGEIVFVGNKGDIIRKYDIIKNNVRLPDIFTILHELGKMDESVTKNIYSVDEVLLYLKSLI